MEIFKKLVFGKNEYVKKTQQNQGLERVNKSPKMNGVRGGISYLGNFNLVFGKDTLLNC